MRMEFSTGFIARRFLRVSACLVAISAAGLTVAANSANAASLQGSWIGKGYVSPKEGARESVTCRISYSQESGKVYGVKATCASPSANIRQTGEVLMVNPNLFVGDFYNPQYDLSGRVRVTISGSSQTVTFSGDHGSGRINLTKR